MIFADFHHESLPDTSPIGEYRRRYSLPNLPEQHSNVRYGADFELNSDVLRLPLWAISRHPHVDADSVNQRSTACAACI